jgi:hypothetical protein
MSIRHAIPISERVRVDAGKRSRRDYLVVCSAAFILIFLFFILPLIRISLGEPPT